ncbi:MAG: RNA-binding protein [Actinomycetota bacterium]
MKIALSAKINWTKLVIASLLIFGLFGFSAMGQDNSKQPLDDEAVMALVSQLKEGLPDLINDEAKVTAITEKWDAREDLAGKTKAQILNLLVADVKSVVTDKTVQDSVWSAWNESTSEESETEDQTEPDKQLEPVKPPVTPTPTENPKPVSSNRSGGDCSQPVKLYVGNLSFRTASADLRELFSQAGTVASATVLEDRETGKSRGFGFVEMCRAEEAESAISQFNGKDFGGRNLTVNKAQPSSNNGKKDGNGGTGNKQDKKLPSRW